MKSNIYLIGFMGTGKSTVLNKLAFMTKYNGVDLDDYIEKKEKKSINDIFAEGGEELFRKLETEYLKNVSEKKEYIVSCGGGTVLRSENVDIMKDNGTVVLLRATPKTIYERVKDTTNRPLLNGNMNEEYIAGMLKKREEFYLNAADIIIDTDDMQVSDICREILEKIKKNSWKKYYGIIE